MTFLQPIVVCWFNMNLGGHHRRSVGSAWQVGFGNIGGIIAVFAFVAADAPLYVKGYSICNCDKFHRIQKEEQGEARSER